MWLFHLEVGDFTVAVKKLLPLYKQVFVELVEAGATYIQVDEPIFVTDEGADLLEAAKMFMLICQRSARS